MERLIVTDSTADLPAEIVKKYGILVMPVNVVLDGTTFRDGVDITNDEFYANYEKYKSMRTEAVRYEDYALAYMKMVQRYDEVICIHCSRHLSETYQIATQVHEDFKKKADCRVAVIDSKTCSMSLGMNVIAAAQATAAGKSFEDVVASVDDIRSRTSAYVAIPTLKYMRKGKKINGFKALVGLALGVKPVLGFEDGRLAIKTKLLGKQKNMILAMMDSIREDIGSRSITLSITYSGDGSLVESLREVFESSFKCRQIYVAQFGPSISINAGPATYGVGYIKHG